MLHFLTVINFSLFSDYNCKFPDLTTSDKSSRSLTEGLIKQRLRLSHLSMLDKLSVLASHNFQLTLRQPISACHNYMLVVGGQQSNRHLWHLISYSKVCKKDISESSSLRKKYLYRIFCLFIAF